MSEADTPPDSPGPSAGAPLCFVLMPFGLKTDNTSRLTVDFDAVYEEIIAPAIRDAGFDPIRGDEEKTGGIIYKPIFERLILCDYAVADLTVANANVFYELGVRHAVRPYSTVLMFASGTALPFDVKVDRGLSYTLSESGSPDNAADARSRLTRHLKHAHDAVTSEPAEDSPVFQLVDGLRDVRGFADLDRLKTDVFRDQALYSQRWKERLARDRNSGIDAVRAAERALGDLGKVEAGILIDLFLSYRAVMGYQEMVDLAGRLPRPVAKTPMVREQLGFALNRLGRRDEAERVLRALIDQRGPSSETNGILGRVYKDQWDQAQKAGQALLADGFLRKAIKAYLKGFEADWRDAYPGINTVTLMEICDPPDERREQLMPVVTYAAERRLGSGKADYWDYATRLELAVLAKDRVAAGKALADALAAVREKWEPESTAGNLQMIREARERRGEDSSWVAELEADLRQRAAER